ncbi:uncharacterized protein LOC134719240 [Mytilus trossulus]|uniref:uncharacterized protein LOC134719240 n=1 Tax=Mytilus trossulus TaxID=6551 RepID=UPI0030041DC2
MRGLFQSKIKSKRSNFFKNLNRSINLQNTNDHTYVKHNYIDIGAEEEVEDEIEGMVIDNDWQVGRRIVELGVLAEKMYCCRCNVPLHLHDTIHERTTGFGSYLHIMCTNQECRTVTDVPTGKVGPTGSFNITAKIVIGMIHAGLGYAQVRNFLTECNLPVMSKSCFQKHEKKIGKIFVSAAEESCKNAQQLEKEISADKELELEVSFDAGWQKRGSGFNYNSLTGHASMIGKQTGKVTCYDIRSKSCKFCEHHEGKKDTVPSHDCCRNWYGSSKSMEPDMAVSMAHKMNDNECPIDVIHADNDSTTMLKLKLDFENLKKKDDQNHTTKGITKSLIELSKRHKELKPGEVIPYLNRCFMYAITQNSSSELEIDEGLSRIVPHVFGDHELCGAVDWCTFKDDPISFKYKSLPNGKPLISEDLRRDLENLIEKYKSKASSLRNLGSTQANESFNHSVATKAPKSKHYGGSQSLASRVSSAVLQKNEGYNYLEQMNEAALLSPGEYTKSIAKKLDSEKLKRKIKRQSREFKIKRTELKKKRNKKERRLNIHEPVSYQSEVATVGLSDTEAITIPSPLKLDGTESFTFFDLETTGLSRVSDITQIAAVHDKKLYQSYVLPRCDISFEASKVTGITCCLAKNKMYVHGKEVDTKSQYESLLDFIEFLKTIPNPILVGHNICNFDMAILSNKLKEFNLFSSFCNVTSGFLDTLKLAKRIFPRNEVDNYKQSTLILKYVGMEYSAHNATEDVQSLQHLFHKKMKNSCKHIDLHSIYYCSCKSTYDSLVQNKTVSRDTCMRLAKNGISLSHLQIANSRDANGIKLLFQEFNIPTKTASIFVSAFATEQ